MNSVFSGGSKRLLEEIDSNYQESKWEKGERIFLTSHHMMSILQSPLQLASKGKVAKKIDLEENMGRTVMPFSFVLESERGNWKEFRKRLSKEDQEDFDRLFDRAKFHTYAAVYKAHSWPMETILLSIILEHEKMLGEILNRLKERGTENN